MLVDGPFLIKQISLIVAKMFNKIIRIYLLSIVCLNNLDNPTDNLLPKIISSYFRRWIFVH
ncbi:hypothetical protein BpHYR1_053104 [Brachionus plicatilis]|uniref:Uncharacterized protein n=1 Tax=Brachionus plicatilis TaxID=10195 RepID=A0A3M7R3X6_BRAPC|nr:hypothetical protein BpHYR1_053104 [Brachionus plicatilis]